MTGHDLRLIGPRLLLWRSWNTDGLHLGEVRSQVAPYVWHPGVNQAQHLNSGLLTASPEYDVSGICRCSHCGFYGFFTPIVNVTNLWGAILVWGRVSLHRTGARGQYAQIVGFWRYDDPVRTLVYGPRLEVIQLLAATFEVPYYSDGIKESQASMEYFRLSMSDSGVYTPRTGEEALSQLSSWSSGA